MGFAPKRSVLLLLGLALGTACSPTITAVLPNTGSVSGGTTVFLQGKGFPEFSTDEVKIWVGDSPCEGVTLLDANKMSCTTSASATAGYADVLLKLPDRRQSTLTNGFLYTRNLKVTPATKDTGLGDTVTFTVSNGAPPYRYEVTQGGGTVEEIDSDEFSFTAPDETGTVIVTVSDRGGETTTATIAVSGYVELSVEPQSGPVSAEWDGRTFQVGDVITLSATGGTPPYSYSNDESAEGSVSGDEYTVLAAGDGTDVITVTDAVDNTDIFTISLRPALDLTVDPVEAIAVRGGQNLTFTITAGQGVPPYTIEPLGGEGTFSLTTSAADGDRIYTPPSDVGSGTVVETVMVTDGLGHTDEIDLTIEPRLQITADDSIEVIRDLPATFTVSGGSGAYFTGALSPPNDDGITVNSSDAIVQWLSATQLQYTAGFDAFQDGFDVISIHDDATGTAGFPSDHTASIVVHVHPPMSIRVTPAAIIAQAGGATTSATFVASGGIPFTGSTPYTFSYSNPTGADPDPSSASITFSDATAAGEIEVTATDSEGNSAATKVRVLAPYEIIPQPTAGVPDGVTSSPTDVLVSTTNPSVDRTVMVGTTGGLNDLFTAGTGDLTFTADAAEAQGLTIRVELDDCSDSGGIGGDCSADASCAFGAEVVLKDPSDPDFTVCIDSGRSTAELVGAAINASADFQAAGVFASVTGSGSSAQSAAAAVTLVGGYAYASHDSDKILYQANFGGTQGATLTVHQDDDPSLGAGEAEVTVDGTDIEVRIDSGTTTVDTVVDAVNDHVYAGAMVTATAVTGGSSAAGDTGSQTLSGGTESHTFEIVSGGAGAIDSSTGLYSTTTQHEDVEVRAEDSEGNQTVDTTILRVVKPVQVAAGDEHSCVRIQHGRFGRIKCWGEGASGQLGQDSNSDIGASSLTQVRDTPYINLGTDSDGNPMNVLDVQTGSAHTCARYRDMSQASLSNAVRIKCWGESGNGQLGIGTTDDRGDSSGEMAALSAVNLGTGRYPAQLAVGSNFTCAVLDDQSARCWGRNADGQLGDDSTTDRSSPVTVDLDETSTGALRGETTILRMAAGREHTCAILSNGRLACWGKNGSDQVGRLQPGSVSELVNFSCQSGGEFPSLYNGGILFSGLEGGAGSNVEIAYVDNVVNFGGEELVDVTFPGGGVARIEIDVNFSTPPGVPYTEEQDVLDAVNGDPLASAFIQASLMPTDTCGGVDEGWGYTDPWDPGVDGYSTLGAAGDPFGVDPVEYPVYVTDASAYGAGSGGDFRIATDIVAGGDYTCAKFLDGTDYKITCWGDNTYGQLGVNTNDPAASGDTDSGEAVLVANADGPMTAGDFHACAVLASAAGDSQVQCWGGNLKDPAGSPVQAGQTGQDTLSNVGDAGLAMGTQGLVNLPTAGTGAVTVPATSISARGYHTCALFEDLRVYCWGLNDNGQLGVGNTDEYGTGAVATDKHTMQELVDRIPTGVRYLDLLEL